MRRDPDQDARDIARKLLSEARHALEERGNPTPALDARLLLQNALNLSREALIANPDLEVLGDGILRFYAFLDRRLRGEPVSRILGYREFYSRRFNITTDTLDPRPDTETLIEAALDLMPVDRPCRIIDLGTGSGIIGVTLLAERPRSRAVLSDISAEALAVAQENAARHGVLGRAAFVHGSWFEGAEGQFDLVLSNPPYIPQAILPTLAPEVRNFDPETALAGGPDGLQAYREIARSVVPFLAAAGRLIIEIGQGQATEIEHIFMSAGLSPEGRWRDLAGHLRCLGFSHVGPRQKRGWK